MPRPHRSTSSFAIVAIASLALPAGGALAKQPGADAHAPGATTHLLSCSNKPLERPTGEVIISCGDGNFAIDKSVWSSWTAESATGTTELQVNPCNPDCASSKMITVRASVRLFDVEHTTRHGAVFAKVGVIYTLHGRKMRVIGYPMT